MWLSIETILSEIIQNISVQGDIFISLTNSRNTIYYFFKLYEFGNFDKIKSN